MCQNANPQQLKEKSTHKSCQSAVNRRQLLSLVIALPAIKVDATDTRRQTDVRTEAATTQPSRQAVSDSTCSSSLPPSRWGCPRASFTFYCLLNYLHKIFQSGISLLFLCHCGRKSRLECNSICALPRPLLVATLAAAAAAFLHIIVGVSLRGRQFQCSPCFSLFLFYTHHLTFPLSLPLSLPLLSCTRAALLFLFACARLAFGLRFNWPASRR